MDNKKELERRDKKINDLKGEIKALKDEISAYKEVLDCAAANIVMLVKEGGGLRQISVKEVSGLLGKYKLTATRDDNGNYLLKVTGENVA